MIKGNELSSRKSIWRKLKCKLLSETSQSEKAKLFLKKGKTMEPPLNSSEVAKCSEGERKEGVNKWSPENF